MMRPFALITKFKPEKGYSELLHLVTAVILPVLVFVLVNKGVVELALALIILSKWRIFAVRPRFWLANVRANAVDIMVGLSFLAFMVQTEALWLQVVWMLLYAGWLAVLKRGSSIFMTSLQAGVGMLAGVSALLTIWATGPSYFLALLVGVICYFSARHFFNNFDEPYTKLLSYLWGYFGAALMWVLAHWLLFYGPIAQPTVLLVAIGYGLGSLYYLDHHEKLSKLAQRQFLFVMVAIVVIVLTLSNWGDKVV